MKPTFKRSQLNAWKREYCDTINGIEYSTYDIKEFNGEFDNAIIIEDEPSIEEQERQQEQERYEKFKRELI